VRLAQRAEPVQLAAGVARRHVGDAAVAGGLQKIHQLRQEAVLELLRALVAGHRVAHVAQIRVGRDRVDALRERQHVRDLRALVRGVDVELRDQLRLDPAQQVVRPVGVVRLGQVRFDLLGERQPERFADEPRQRRAGAELL